MSPEEQRKAIIAMAVALAEARATGNAKLYSWACVAADAELLQILPDLPPKPTISDFVCLHQS